MFVYLKKTARGKIWYANFGDHNLGRRSLGLTEDVTEGRAVSTAAKLLRELLSVSPQLALPTVSRAELTHFAQALDLWQPTHEAPTDDGQAWVRQYAKRVRRGLGDAKLSELVGRAGTLRLQAYRDELAEEKLALKTRKNCFWIVRRVLEFACNEGLMSGLPAMPNPRRPGEYTRGPVFDYIDEATLRAVVTKIYTNPGSVAAIGAQLFPHLPPVERAPLVQTYIAGRRLYLSVGFYTGMRTRDLDNTIGADLNPDFGKHRRRASKTGAPDSWLTSPEQLTVDCKFTRAAMGQCWHANAPVLGGPWKKVGAVMSDVREALGLSVSPSPRILRRSFVRQLFLRGWTVDAIKQHMGHAYDSQMVHVVYLDTPEAPARCFGNIPAGGIPWTIESTQRLESQREHEGGRVVAFTGGRGRGASLFETKR